MQLGLARVELFERCSILINLELFHLSRSTSTAKVERLQIYLRVLLDYLFFAVLPYRDSWFIIILCIRNLPLHLIELSDVHLRVP